MTTPARTYIIGVPFAAETGVVSAQKRNPPAMCGVRSLIIAVVLGIVGSPAAGSADTDGLCAQLDPSSRLEGLEYFPLRESRVQREFRHPVGLEALREALPEFLSDLEQRDPVMRIEAVARFGVARAWVPPGSGAVELDQWLINRLQHESQGQVVEAIIRVLGEHTDTPGLAPILIELIQCDRDPALRSAALEVANAVSDPALLEPLIGAWRTNAARVDRASALRALARLRDRRSLDVAMEGLREGFLEARPLMRAVGTQKDVSGVIEIYKRYPRPLAVVNEGVLDLIGDLGGPEATAFIRTEFERSEGDRKAHLGRLALRAQLERGKPEWTEADRRNCVPLEEIRSRRLPYAQKEVDRLLRAENEPFFRALVWQGYQDIRDSFMERSRHLDPPRRVEQWRRVVSMLGGDPSKQWSPAAEPVGELVKALASAASQTAPTKPRAALHDIDEAISLQRVAWTNESSRADRLLEVRARVERLLRSSSQGEKGGMSQEQLGGTYQRGTGLEGHTLTLDRSGSFEFEGQSDSIDGCTGGRWNFSGTFHLEGGYVAVEPGPTLRRYGIDGPDLLLPVASSGRLYLVEEASLESFCQWESDGRLRNVAGRFFYSRPSLAPPTGVLDPEAACRDREPAHE